MNIHRTAIVDPEAKLGVDIEIGAYVVIDGCIKIGDYSRIESHVVIEGDVRIGAKNTIGPGAVIGTPPQDVSFSEKNKTSVEIGDENIIREHCTIHRPLSFLPFPFQFSHPPLFPIRCLSPKA